MKTLILTEKPSVARDFAKALNAGSRTDGYIESGEYIITWGIGHLLELLEPHEYHGKWKSWRLDAMPILPDQFRYKPIPGTHKQLNIVTRLLSKPLKQIVIATDAGREGEVIARTILLHAGVSEPGKIRRFWTSQALTPQVIREGMNALAEGAAYDRLWNAGQARQIADWLVGMNCTRAATLKEQAGSPKSKGKDNLFSVGRVQTAVLALLADRRRERENFKPEPYWQIRARFVNEKGTWKGLWFKKKQTRIDTEAAAQTIAEKVKGQTGAVTSVSRRKRKEPPPPLFSLTELQREANRKFGLSAQNTLDIAQSLYEQRKCLSYPRTDSTVLGSKNVEMAKGIVNRLSDVYPDIFAGVEAGLIRASNKRVFNDAKLTDHHALIPLAPVPDNATQNERKIYDLVLRRFSGAFHPDCEFEQTEIITRVSEETFQTKGRRILKPGWRVVYADAEADRKSAAKASGKETPSDADEEAQELPPVEKEDPATAQEAAVEKKMTRPPPEYTEALLLKEMTNPGRYVGEDDLKKVFRGEVGLGTQATRAQIIETLLKRKYAARKKRHLIATDKGCHLIETLRGFKSAGILTSPEETARWEMQLEEIARGQGKAEAFLSGIRELIQQIISEFKADTGTRELGHCPACGGSVVEGTKGYGCANWRDADGGCKFVIWKTIAQKPIPYEMAKELLTRRRIGPIQGFISRKGKPFNASLALTEEADVWKVTFDFDEKWGQNRKSGRKPERKPAKRPTSQKPVEGLGTCPACGGTIIEGRRGYGCANWRDEDGRCRFVIWKTIAGKPISKALASRLLENGETEVLDGFVSSEGTAFSGRLKIEKNSDSGVPEVVLKR